MVEEQIKGMLCTTTTSTTTIIILITLKLLPCLASQVQKMVTFNTCSMIRKFLNNEVHLSD
jgi:hypothetical protein